MIEPLPKARSICESAASSALVLSTDVPSTRRRLAALLTAKFLLTWRKRVAQRRAKAAMGPSVWRHCAWFVLFSKPISPFVRALSLSRRWPGGRFEGEENGLGSTRDETSDALTRTAARAKGSLRFRVGAASPVPLGGYRPTFLLRPRKPRREIAAHRSTPPREEAFLPAKRSDA